MPARIQFLVFRQLGGFQVVWHGIGKLNLQLLQRGFFAVLLVEFVKRAQGERDAFWPHVVRQGNEVEIVPRCVALQDEDAFDALRLTAPDPTQARARCSSA
jgi:hypothetical protein